LGFSTGKLPNSNEYGQFLKNGRRPAGLSSSSGARDVRITFKSIDWYSKIETDAKKVTNKSLPTMRLKWKNQANEMNRQILHEFGRAEHEHCSPNFPYNWKKAPVTNYWKGIFKRWNPAWDDNKVTVETTKKFDNDIARHLSQKDHPHITLYYIKQAWLVPLAETPGARDFPEKCMVPPR
jgi:hypothetical protein